tara:strand:- start:4751 stop:6997 length:2247 start_codon:yes stop_codon:yes gene_type:complete
MGKSSPSAPAAPDPTKTAVAQGQMNKETAAAQANLNRYDEYTPFGQSTWTQADAPSPEDFVPEFESQPIYAPGVYVEPEYDDYGEVQQDGYFEDPKITGWKQVQINKAPDPLDPTARRWTRTTTIDPAQQAIFDKQNAVTNALNEVAVSQTGRVSDALAQPFSYEGAPDSASTAGVRTAADRISQLAASGFNLDGLGQAPSAGGISGTAARAAQIAGDGFNYGGLAPAASAQGISSAADIAAGSVSSPFGLSGTAPTAAGISAAANRGEAGMAQPFNYAGLPSAPGTAGAEAAVGTATSSFADPYNYSGAPAAPSGDAAARQQVIDSVYGQHASRLDPRFATEQERLETQLANSGIVRGSQAFGSSMDNFSRAKNDAYQSAQNAAIQAGGAEQSRLFGLGSAARQNAINESNYLRGLPAAEQGQLLDYQSQLSGLQGQARARGAQERLTEREVPISDAERLQTMRAREFDASQAVRGRSVEEDLMMRGMPMAEQQQVAALRGQQFDAQAMERATAANERLAQRGVALSEQDQLANFYGREFDAQGTVRDRGLQDRLTQRQIPLAEQQAAYNAQQGLFGLDQAARARAIEESAYLRNLPLNETSALMSGNQINSPQFSAGAQVGVQNTDYAGMVADNYANQMNAYNSKIASNNATTGAMAGVLGAGIKAFGPAIIASDRRVKQNISKVGVLDNGLPVYSFQYIWGGPQQIGLMAQDVEKVNPDAVLETSGGIKMVNYSKAVSELHGAPA